MVLGSEFQLLQEVARVVWIATLGLDPSLIADCGLRIADCGRSYMSVAFWSLFSHYGLDNRHFEDGAPFFKVCMRGMGW